MIFSPGGTIGNNSSGSIVISITVASLCFNAFCMVSFSSPGFSTRTPFTPYDSASFTKSGVGASLV